MKTSDILDIVGDKSITERVWSRRSVLKGSAASTAALVLAGMPFGLAAVATKAYAQSTPPDAAGLGALQLALKLEYLESDFYTQGVAAKFTTPFTAAEAAAIGQIQKHEAAHVALLKGALGANAPATVPHDYTGGSGNGNGPFQNVFTDKKVFLNLAQLFEDTGVRAYKGQAGNLISPADKYYLTVALRIHSVEARHAAKVRILRGQTAYITTTPVDAGFSTTKGGNSMSQADYAGVVYGAGSPATDYPAESNTTQAGTNLTTLPGVTAARAAEAFDEPLDTKTVVTIAGLFGVK